MLEVLLELKLKGLPERRVLEIGGKGIKLIIELVESSEDNAR